MAYEPHLIADFKTGIETDRQPWLIPDDAQKELFDGYVYRAIIHKRDGYNFLANGQEGGAPYCESRMVSRVSGAAMSGAIDSANDTYTITATTPLRRGTFTVSGTVPVQSVTDNGIGGFTGDGTGTINYTTGVVSITFDDPPTGGTVLADYDFHPGKPVMMVASFVTSNNTRQMIVADTENLNRLNTTTNRLDDITVRTYTGTNSDFFTWTQYPTILDTPRLLFANNVDQIQSYDGTNAVDWVPVIESTTAPTENESGTGITGPYAHTTSLNPVMPTSLSIVADGSQTVTDDGTGNLVGAGTWTINYSTGVVSVTFNSVVPVGSNNITFDYEHATDYVITCLKILNFKDRAVLSRTTEVGGVVHPQRLGISGTGQSGDDFRTSASGAGVIDIPTPYWNQGADFNRDDVMIFTEREHWLLKFTGNDVVPFTLDKIDGTRGNLAPFAPISYLNFTKAYSPYGFTISDGYQIQRYDDRIPDFSFNEIDQDNFDLCFSGVVEDDRNHYLIYPTQSQTTSDQILVNNYDENNFSKYRIPLSCMGTFFESFDITWDDLSAANGFNTWADFGAKYATWNSISWSKDQPISIGGGHEGEIWRLNANEGEDNPLRIWGIASVTSSPTVVDITTDWHNYKVGDYIFVSGTAGSTELNTKQGFIVESGIIDDNTIRVQFQSANPGTFTAWTSGGTVSRTIPFEFITKNFNPYSSAGQKVRCGWIYFYIDAAQTMMTDAKGNRIAAKLDIEVYSNDTEYPTQVTSVGLGYEANMTTFDDRISLKVWRKVFINQTSRFIQFRVSNTQPGTRIKIHALMPGFMPGGRMI